MEGVIHFAAPASQGGCRRWAAARGASRRTAARCTRRRRRSTTRSRDACPCCLRRSRAPAQAALRGGTGRLPPRIWLARTRGRASGPGSAPAVVRRGRRVKSSLKRGGNALQSLAMTAHSRREEEEACFGGFGFCSARRHVREPVPGLGHRLAQEGQRELRVAPVGRGGGAGLALREQRLG